MSQPDRPNPAEIYEQILVSKVFQPLARAVLQAAPPARSLSLLDAACGTAIVLREAMKTEPGLGRAVGIDLNPAMIEVARAVVERDGIEAELHVGSVDSMPFADGEFGQIYCQQGLQFFPDRSAALSEMHRVLSDNGAAVIIVWQSIDKHPYLRDINQIAVDRTGHEILADPFSLGDREELGTLIDQAGFRDRQISDTKITMRSEEPLVDMRLMLTGATAAIPAFRALDDAERASIINDVIEHAPPLVDAYSVNGEVAVEWHASVAVALK